MTTSYIEARRREPVKGRKLERVKQGGENGQGSAKKNSKKEKETRETNDYSGEKKCRE